MNVKGEDVFVFWSQFMEEASKVIDAPESKRPPKKTTASERRSEREKRSQMANLLQTELLKAVQDVSLSIDISAIQKNAESRGKKGSNSFFARTDKDIKKAFRKDFPSAGGDSLSLYRLFTTKHREIAERIDDLGKSKNDFLRHAVKLWLHEGICTDVLEHILAMEVGRTISKETLFRGNSLGTHLLGIASYYVLNGTDFMNGLKEQISCILKKGKKKDLLAPSNIEKQTRRILDYVFNSKSLVPPKLRRISRVVRTTSASKFPDMELLSVSGFFFLRVVCPMVSTPDKFGIVKRNKVTAEQRRLLVSVASIIQNVANMRVFRKESNNSVHNEFSQKEIPHMKKYLEWLSCYPGSNEEVCSDQKPESASLCYKEFSQDFVGLYKLVYIDHRELFKDLIT